MAKTTIWKELTSSFSRNHVHQRRLKYFRWKFGLDTNRFTYSEMSEDDIKKLTKVTEIEWLNLIKWESTPQFKRLQLLLKEDKFADDMLEVYDAVKERAVEETDGQAIKNMLLLQKEIKDYRESIEEFEELEEKEEDDGLII